jgi:hypothetical protein
VVLLDLDAMQDATFEYPRRYPDGIPFVMVNGQWVVKHSAFTGTLPGLLAGGE